MNKKQKSLFTAAILDSSLSSKDKQFVLDLLNFHTKAVPKVPRIRNADAPQLLSIGSWERIAQSPLCFSMVASWVKEKGFCPVIVTQLIEEFRIEMISKNKHYADFKSAFQNYLNKGYLSKTPYQALLANSPHRDKSGTEIYTRGNTL